MAPGWSLFFVLRVVAILLTATTAVRLLQTGLHRCYPVFFVYLCAHVVRMTALFLAPSQNAYGGIFLWTQPLFWLFDIVLVLELYSLVLKNYSGLRTVGRWALYVALALSFVFTAATLLPAWRNPTEKYPVIFYFATVQRGLSFSLVVFLLVILGFLAWYPVPLSRNLLTHSIIYAVYFLSSSMAFLVRNVLGETVMRGVNTVLSFLTCGCLLAWILFLTREGEAKQVMKRMVWKSEDEQRLVEQLAAINASLQRVVRK